MNLRQIEIFHAVYLHGTVSAAARALNVSQFKSIGRLVWSDAGRWTHPPPLRDYRFGERRRT